MKTSIIRKTTITAIGMATIFLLPSDPQAQVKLSSGSPQPENRQGTAVVPSSSPSQSDNNMRVEIGWAGKRATFVSIYRSGSGIQNGTLRVLDVRGNLVKRISVSERGARVVRGERLIGTWDLTDMTGRQVHGTFTISGTVRTQGGRSEEVSLTFTTRGGGGHYVSGARGTGVAAGHDMPADATTNITESAAAADAPVAQAAAAEVAEAVTSPAEPPAETPVETPAGTAPTAEQTPPDPNAQLRSDKDAMFARLDQAVAPVPAAEPASAEPFIPMTDISEFNARIANRTDIATAEQLISVYVNVPEEELAEGNQTVNVNVRELGNNRFEITRIHDNMLDDSVLGQKTIMIAEKRGAAWVLIEAKRNWKCREGRGNTNWGTETCR